MTTEQLILKAYGDSFIAHQTLDAAVKGQPVRFCEVLNHARSLNAAVQELERRQAGVMPPKEGE